MKAQHIAAAWTTEDLVFISDIQKSPQSSFKKELYADWLSERNLENDQTWSDAWRYMGAKSLHPYYSKEDNSFWWNTADKGTWTGVIYSGLPVPLYKLDQITPGKHSFHGAIAEYLAAFYRLYEIQNSGWLTRWSNKLQAKFQIDFRPVKIATDLPDYVKTARLALDGPCTPKD